MQDDPYISHQLLDAIISNNLAKVQEYAPKFTGWSTYEAFTMILNAMIYDHREIFVYLLDMSGAVNRISSATGDTLLHHAISRVRDRYYIIVLIAKGANVNVENNRNETPMHVALSNNNLVAVELLLHSTKLWFEPSDESPGLYFSIAVGNAYTRVQEIRFHHQVDNNPMELTIMEAFGGYLHMLPPEDLTGAKEMLESASMPGMPPVFRNRFGAILGPVNEQINKNKNSHIEPKGKQRRRRRGF